MPFFAPLSGPNSRRACSLCPLPVAAARWCQVRFSSPVPHLPALCAGFRGPGFEGSRTIYVGQLRYGEPPPARPSPLAGPPLRWLVPACRLAGSAMGRIPLVPARSHACLPTA